MAEKEKARGLVGSIEVGERRFLEREEESEKFRWNNYSLIVIRSCHVVLRDNLFSYRK